MSKNTTGLCAALLLSTPFLLLGAIAVAEREYHSNTRLGTTIDLSGAPAVAVGAGHLGVGICVIAVALAQWPGVRAVSTAIAVLSGAGAVVGFAISVFS